MSSWFGNGISQITGQISSFTKEVLTEGTEEVDDHATQLKITRDRLVELDGVCISQRAEIERLHKIKEELQEKVESSELQIAAISSEYRNILHQKESEIQQLQHQHHALIEASQKPTGLNLESGEHLEDHDDFDSYPRTSITQAARQHKSPSPSLEDHGDLHSKIQALQAQLSSDKDSHQAEQAALQDAHSQKIVQLKKRHKEEVKSLKEELASLRSKHDGISADAASADAALQEQVRHLESISHKQSVDLSLIHAADKQKAELLEENQRELNECRKQLEQVQLELNNVQMKEKNLLEDLDAITNDNRRLKDHVAQMSHVSAFSPTSSTPLSKKRPGSQSAAEFDENINDSIISSNFSQMSIQTRHLDDQVTSLQAQVDKYETEIEHFEMVKSDWLIEKEALEEVLMKLRDQLRDKEEALSIAQAEQKTNEPSTTATVQSSQGLLALTSQHPSSCDRGLNVTPGEIEEDLEDLNQQVALLTEGSARLENEHDILVIEKEQLLLDLHNEKDKVSTLQRQLSTVKKEASDSTQLSALKSQLDSVRAELVAKQQEIDRLNRAEEEGDHRDLVKELNVTKSQLEEANAEREGLMESLEELDAQHQQAIQQVIESRQKLQQSHEDLKMQLESLQNESKNAGPESTATQEGPSELERKLTEELKTLKSELEQAHTGLKAKVLEFDRLDADKDKLSEELKEKGLKLEEITRVLNDLHMDKQEQQARIGELEAELHKVRVELNSSRGEHRQAEEECARLKQELAAKTSQVVLLKEGEDSQNKEARHLEELEKNREQLEKQVSSLKKKLLSMETEVTLLRVDNEGLSEQLTSLRKAQEEAVLKVTQQWEEKLRSEKVTLTQEWEEKLHTEKVTLTQEWEEKLKTEKVTLTQEWEEKLNTEKVTLTKEWEEKINTEKKILSQEWEERLCTEKSAMLSVRDSMERELSSTEHLMQEKTRQYEQYIAKLNQSRDLDASELQEEHQRLMKASHDKDGQIHKLMEQIQQLQGDLEYTKDMLQTTIDGQSHITNLLSEKDSEIDGLKRENGALTEQNEGQGNLLKQHEAELERLNHIEKMYRQLTEDHKKLRIEQDELKRTLRNIESEEKAKEIESKTLGVITDLEQELTQLQNSLAAKDQTIQKLNSQLLESSGVLEDRTAKLEKANESCNSLTETLTKIQQELHKVQETMDGLESELQEKRELVLNKDNLIQTLQQTILDKESQLSQASVKLQGLSSIVVHSESNSQAEPAKTSISQELQSSHSESNGEYNGDSEIVDKMRHQIVEKDEVISSFKQKNQTLTKLLEERSIALHGDATLVDIHRLESEVGALRLEKEQMMQVLNDKTRECSQLKGEVHKLMNVVSAEKAALSKLQQDNHHLQQHEEEKPASDMSKEAIKNLSRMIRDKDLEIESLSQKNETLLQVLQESSQEGSQISGLIQERDNLAKQVSVFLNDRQQIIAALNAKHQESVAYHGEIQRLQGLISQENAKQDRLQQEYSVLVAQYEDRQRALVSTQQELIALKQRLQQVLREKEDILSREQSSREHTPESDKECINLSAGDNKASSDQQADNKVEKEAVQGNNRPEEDSVVINKDIPVTNEDGTEISKETGEAVVAHSSDDTMYRHYLAEIESLKTVIQMQEQAFAEKDSLIRGKDQDLKCKDSVISEKDATLDEKDKAYSELSTRFHKTEQMLRTRDSEMNSLRKQNENLAFQLHGLQTEVGDLRQEKDQLSSKSMALDNQMDMVKEANNKLSMALKDHAFELNALKEKNNTLTRLLQEKGSDEKEKGEMDRLMKETETLQHQARAFKVDADQFAMALQQQQEENRELKTELQKIGEREQKLSREVERLRGHLMQVEEGYTRELLEAEEREKDLRNRLAAAEDRALSASSSVDRANLQASKQVESLQQQLHTLSEQRDKAVLQLASVQDQANQYAAQLSNLQMVLEQFQQEKEQQQAAEIEFYLREVSSLKQEKQSLQREMHQLQLELEESNEAVAAAQRLSDQLDRKEEMVSALREEVQLRERELSEAEDRIDGLKTSVEGKIEKALARNLLLGYFHASASQKNKVIQVMAKTLDFSQSELQQLQGESSSSWLRGIFKRSSPPQSQPSTPSRQVSAAGSIDKSFSELFVTFLERESSPQPQVRLPVEEMAKEQQERRKTAFNPFSGTLPSSSTPFSASSSQHDPLGIGHPTTPLSIPPLGDRPSQQAVRSQLNINTEDVAGNLFTTGGVGAGRGGSREESHLLMAATNLPVFTPSTLHSETQPQSLPRSSTLLKQALQQS